MGCRVGSYPTLTGTQPAVLALTLTTQHSPWVTIPPFQAENLAFYL